jgi:hypothetical protein
MVVEFPKATENDDPNSPCIEKLTNAYHMTNLFKWLIPE